MEYLREGLNCPVFLFFKDTLILYTPEKGKPRLPNCSDINWESLDYSSLLPLKSEEEIRYLAASIEKIPDNAGFIEKDLRSLYREMEEPHIKAAGIAVQLIKWERETLFCPRCASALRNLPEERRKSCTVCGESYFPPVTPAVLALVTRRSKILLAHNKIWLTERYSVIAGFVEPGETLEECVYREVLEESGIRIKNIKYFLSQPWPFPHSLMLGFTAEYAGGDVVPDGIEIDKAGWFELKDLPDLPMQGSLSRKLIDWYCNKYEQNK